MIDVRMLKAGQEFEEIHDSYVIFITEKDVIGMGLPVYHVDRTIEESGEKFEDGSHIIYVNGSYRNNEEEIGRLMHDFRCEASDEMLNSMLSEHVRYYKESKGGLTKMCELVEELVAEFGEIRAREIAEERVKEITEKRVKETAKETAIRMLKKGKLSLEEIAEYSNLPLDVVEKLQKKLK